MNKKLTLSTSISDKPGPPENLRVETVSESSVSLAWSYPTDDGGAPVVRYMVEQSCAIKRNWTFASSASSCSATVEGLSSAEKYTFRVAAENQCGIGEFAELVEEVAMKEPGRWLAGVKKVKMDVGVEKVGFGEEEKEEIDV